MSIKNKLFWGALLLISVSWVVNVIYAQSQKLAEPIFLPHYMITEQNSANSLDLYYLTNANDPAKIKRISFNGFTGYVEGEQWDRTIQTLAHYALRQATIYIDPLDLETPLTEKQTTEEIDVFFSDGSTLTTSIGEITMLPDMPMNDVLDPIGTSGSNRGDSVEWYQVKEDLQIDQVLMDIPKGFESNLTVRLDAPTLAKDAADGVVGIPLDELKFPFELKKGDTLYIYSDLSLQLISSLQLPIILSGTTASGETFETYNSLSYSQQPILEKADLRKLIEAWEGSE